MSVSFELPNDVEQQLQVALGDLGLAAKRALLIDAYSRGRISVGRLAETLGMGVLEAQQWLVKRNISLNYSLEEFQEDQETLAKLFGRSGEPK